MLFSTFCRIRFQLFWIFLSTVLNINSFAQNNPPNNWLKLYHSQISQSISKGFNYQKKVFDKEKNNSEVKSFKINAQTEATLTTDLFYSTNFQFNKPNYQGYFSIIETQNIIEATLKPEYWNKTELKSQKIHYFPNSQRISMLQTTQSVSNWLYSTDIEITIWFTSDGNYQKHNLTFKSNVLLLGSYGDFTISAEAAYYQ